MFGWWSPSDTLANPNILATYFPWFSPLVHALVAGFFEESLFRAVPLATAALIGRRFGKERLCIMATLIIQALIFGAAHASYPAQPSYVRIIELFFPSLAFGWLYLMFGLLPGIIAHVMYDVALMALPLFVSSAPGSFINQLIILIAASIPLLIIVLQAWRSGSKFLHSAPLAYKNSSWQPAHSVSTDTDFTLSHKPLGKKVC